MIREAQPDDSRLLAQIYIRSWQEAYVHLMPKNLLHEMSGELDDYTHSWRKIVEDYPARKVWIDLSNEKAVGLLEVGDDVEEDGTKIGEIKALHYLREVWGTGQASEMLRIGLNYLTNQGCRFTRLNTFSDNGRAIAFYKKHGFSFDGKKEVNEYGDGNFLVEVTMRRENSA